MKTARLPNLICPGAEKAGTTSLYSILVQHSEIFDPRIKEPMFFNRYFYKGIRTYEKLYRKCGQERYIPDFTVLYMTREIYVQRILDTLGSDIRIIILLRNPVDRFFSHYHMKRNNGSELEEDISVVFKKDRAAFIKNADDSEYFSHGLYSRQVEWFLSRFPRDNIFLLLFEDFVKDSSKTVNEILYFLGLDPEPGMEVSMHSNQTVVSKQGISKVLTRKLIRIVPESLKTALPTRLRARFLNIAEKMVYTKGQFQEFTKDLQLCREIIESYREDIERLERMTGMDLSDWIDKYGK
ncbi:MAG TPA: sulfotransferase domain-containing protein [Clostridia bacterium]|nr:sulfotransferase domain-containing protein [Clostridia bacterium]